jgi:hypothetical protein
MPADYVPVDVERVVRINSDKFMLVLLDEDVQMWIPLRYIADGDSWEPGEYADFPQTIEVRRDIAEKHNLI